MIYTTFNETNFYLICDELSARDKDLYEIISLYGYPPLWSRKPSFVTLLRIILEQQVSLASAKAAFLKLQKTIGNIAPEKILLLTNEEMKACYFSRQKIVYAKNLAEAIVDKKLLPDHFEEYTDESIKKELKKIKGIGDWTADIFLMMALHRCNCFPSGDVALMTSLKEVKRLPATVTLLEISAIIKIWEPYKTIAAYLLWHAYIKKRNMSV